MRGGRRGEGGGGSLVLHSAAEENGVSMLRKEGTTRGTRGRFELCIGITFRNPTLVTTSPAAGPQRARDAGLGLEVTERVPSDDLVPQPRKQTARRDQERQLLAIQSEAGNAERSGAKRSKAERSGAERSGAERSGNRDEPIKPDRFPRCTSATPLTYRRARTSECTSASEIRLGKYTR